MTSMLKPLLALGVLAVLAADVAQAAPRGGRDGSGPVASACKADIANYCSALSHGTGDIRNCLELKRTQISKACATALDGTGRRRDRR